MINTPKATRNLKRIVISESESKTLEAVIQNDWSLNHRNPGRVFDFAQKVGFVLLPRLSSELVALSNGDVNAVFLSGLPEFRSNECQAENLTKNLSIFIGALLGSPFQYQQQNGGEVAARVAPEAGFENTNSSAGKMEFGWHSDNSFLPAQYRTDWIVLSGFINGDHVLTKLSEINATASYLTSHDLSMLLQPRFSLRVPTSFRLSGHVETSVNSVPLLWYDGKRRLNIAVALYNAYPTLPDDHQAAKALLALKQAANLASETCDIQRGCALIFHNDKYLHGRNVIPGERILFRVYVKQNLRELRKSTGNKNDFVFDLKKIFNELNLPEAQDARA